MPDENCSVVNCSTCIITKNKGLGILKLPSARFYKEWRAKWLNELTKHRVVDSNFRNEIQNDTV